MSKWGQAPREDQLTRRAKPVLTYALGFSKYRAGFLTFRSPGEPA